VQYLKEMGSSNSTETKLKPALLPSLVYSLMFPGPPEKCKIFRTFPSLRTNGKEFRPNVYFVPSSRLTAQSGVFRNKFIACPTLVKCASLNHKNDIPVRPFVLLYFHGNAEELEDSVGLIDALQTYLNCTVVAMEFPGYGITKDHFQITKPHEIDLWAEDVLLWLTQRLQIPGDRIIPFGRSIGTGPAARLAEIMWTKYNWAAPGLVLNAPYLSINEMGRLIAGSFGGYIAGNPWNTEAAILSLQHRVTKLLILHGIEDDIIPCDQGRALFDLYIGGVSAHFPENKGHNDFTLEDYLFPLNEFFKKYFDDNPAYQLNNVSDFINGVQSHLLNWREVPREYVLPPYSGSSISGDSDSKKKQTKRVNCKTSD